MAGRPRQFKGVYPSDVMQAIGKRSKVFVKRTQTKARTATARMLDLLFPAGGDRNYIVDPTPKPTRRRRSFNVVQLIAQAKGRMPERDEGEGRGARHREAPVERDDADHRRPAHRDPLQARVQEGHQDGNLYGTGILKGPAGVERRVRVRYVFDENTRNGRRSRKPTRCRSWPTRRSGTSTRI